MAKRTTPAPQISTQDELLRAAKATLDKLDNITTEEFSRGGEREEREALRAAVERIEREQEGR